MPDITCQAVLPERLRRQNDVTNHKFIKSPATKYCVIKVFGKNHHGGGGEDGEECWREHLQTQTY